MYSSPSHNVEKSLQFVCSDRRQQPPHRPALAETDNNPINEKLNILGYSGGFT